MADHVFVLLPDLCLSLEFSTRPVATGRWVGAEMELSSTTLGLVKRIWMWRLSQNSGWRRLRSIWKNLPFHRNQFPAYSLTMIL